LRGGRDLKARPPAGHAGTAADSNGQVAGNRGLAGAADGPERPGTDRECRSVNALVAGAIMALDRGDVASVRALLRELAVVLGRPGCLLPARCPCACGLVRRDIQVERSSAPHTSSIVVVSPSSGSRRAHAWAACRDIDGRRSDGRLGLCVGCADDGNPCVPLLHDPLRQEAGKGLG